MPGALRKLEQKRTKTTELSLVKTGFIGAKTT
jgi:hypothetical protein